MAPLIESRVSLPGVLKFFFVFGLCLLVLTYVIFQARNLLMGPSITLHTPPQGTIQHDRTILLEGNTENIVSLTLNGREIHTDGNGVFSERLVLENGYTIMTLRAEDRYGRENTLTREFVYTPL